MISPGDVTIAICTYQRPDVLRNCLSHVQQLTAKPYEVIVVDASPDDTTRSVVQDFDGVRYVRNDSGLGTLPRSRKIALETTSSPVLAFIDDDAFPEPAWLEAIARGFKQGVGGVTGRSRNGVPGEDLVGGEVGTIRRGQVVGNFASAVVDERNVDHVMGCNMAFLCEALIATGGIPEWRAGVSAVGEDLMLSLLVRQSGWTLRFVPDAVVLHVGAPQVKGRRFDLRYQFVAARNYTFVFAAIDGLASKRFLEFCAHTLRQSLREAAKSVCLLSCRLAGVVVGTCRSISARSARR